MRNVKDIRNLGQEQSIELGLRLKFETNVDCDSFIELISNFGQQINLIKNLQEIKSFDTNQLIFKHLNENI